MTWTCKNCGTHIVRNPSGSDGWYHPITLDSGDMRYRAACEYENRKTVAEPKEQ